MRQSHTTTIPNQSGLLLSQAQKVLDPMLGIRESGPRRFFGDISSVFPMQSSPSNNPNSEQLFCFL